MTDKKKEFGFQWHITDMCNMRCKHCYQNEYSKASEVGLAGLRLIADTVFGGMKDTAVSVNLTGGEPLLVPYIFEFIEQLHGFENLKELHIITNGTMASHHICGAIESFSKIGFIKISIESGNPSVNDAIRGAGSLGRVIKGIDSFKRYTNKPVVLMMTLGKYNVNTISSTVEFAIKHQVSGIIFERFIPLGSGQQIAGDVLGPREWSDAVRAIAKAAGTDAEPEDLLPYKAFWLHMKRSVEDNLEGALCNLGKHSMAVMPNGDVFPCRRLPVPVGNLVNDSFMTVLERLESFEGDMLKEKLHGDICGLCGLDDCTGCRALAYALTGDLFADDTQCALTLL